MVQTIYCQKVIEKNSTQLVFKGLRTVAPFDTAHTFCASGEVSVILNTNR